MTEEPTKVGYVSSTASEVSVRTSVTRNSTGKIIPRPSLSPLGSAGNTPSRYLSPSVSSCHDRCKYGGHHTFEDHREHSASFRSFRNKARLAKREKSDDNSTSEKKTSAGKQKALNVSQTKTSERSGGHAPRTPLLTKSIDSTKSAGDGKQSGSSSFRKNQSVQLDVDDQNNLSNVNGVDNLFEEVLVNHTLSDVPKFEISEMPKTTKQENEISPSTNGGDLHNRQKIIEPDVSLNEIGKKKSWSSKPKASVALSKGSESNRRKSLPLNFKANEVISLATKRNVLSAKSVNTVTSPNARKVDAPSKRATSSAPKETTTKMKPKPQIQMLKSRSPLRIARVPSSKAKGASKLTKRDVIPKASQKKTTNPQRSEMRKPLAKTNSSMKSSDTKPPSRTNLKRSVESEAKDGNVKENTLFVVSDKAESVGSNSVQPGNSDCKSSPLPSSPLATVLGNEKDIDDSETTYTEETETLSDSYSEDEMDNDQAGDSIDENKKTHRRSHVGHPNEEATESRKLKFRRGKVVDLQSEDNAPRRLKFRRPRERGINRKDEIAQRKNFKKRDEIEGGDLNDEAEVVNLRHQGAQDKKDAQGLFNEVIEVTATKLVESRKSKVKALVGAFETVISLQETKPASSV